jgi:hypothetical protein
MPSSYNLAMDLLLTSILSPRLKEPLCSGPPSKANLLAPKQTITFDTTNGGIKQCLSLLSTYVHQVFTRPKSLYIDQYLYNQKAHKISKIAKKARMNETAKRTVDELLKTDKAGSERTVDGG